MLPICKTYFASSSNIKSTAADFLYDKLCASSGIFLGKMLHFNMGVAVDSVLGVEPVS